MELSIFGLGHIGCVSAACLAKLGNHVTGFDINQKKIDMINKGKSPIFEKDLEGIIREQVKAGKLMATNDINQAIDKAKIVFICVDTPSNGNGSINFKDVEKVCKDIGVALKSKKSFTAITLRSTILPDLVEKIAISVIEQYSEKKVGKDFGFALNPEFLREGTAVDDFFNPPRTLIAPVDERSAKLLETLYATIKAPLFKLTLQEASMLKYADNSFHAIKVAFANEIGRLCKAYKIDSRKVMQVFAQDLKLNLSPYYLKPGFAFGGSCLPKDLKAIAHQARQYNIHIPLIQSVLPSNTEHINYALNLIEQSKYQSIGILGLSFKGGTDDLRESPIIYLVEELLNKNYNVRIYDRTISMAQTLGSTKEYIERELSHLANLLCKSKFELIENTQVLVVANWTKEHKEIVETARNGHKVIDLIGIIDDGNQIKEAEYEGICW